MCGLLAYKVLSDGRSGFTGAPWPLPRDGQPGDWVRAEGPIALCENGVHACTADQLPQWLGMEIWEIELGGEILRTEPALIAAQARLVRKLEAWDEPARGRFIDWCLKRGREITTRYPAGAGLVAKVEHTVSWAGAAPAAYFTAMLAGESVSGRHSGPAYEAGFVEERARQGTWLRTALDLTH
jgi:hypothetical protein